MVQPNVILSVGRLAALGEDEIRSPARDQPVLARKLGVQVPVEPVAMYGLIANGGYIQGSIADLGALVSGCLEVLWRERLKFVWEGVRLAVRGRTQRKWRSSRLRGVRIQWSFALVKGELGRINLLIS